LLFRFFVSAYFLKMFSKNAFTFARKSLNFEISLPMKDSPPASASAAVSLFQQVVSGGMFFRKKIFLQYSAYVKAYISPFFTDFLKKHATSYHQFSLFLCCIMML